MTLQLLGPRLAVRRIAETDQQSSLIEVVTLSEVPSQFAICVLVGTGRETAAGARVPVDVNPGDTVILGKYSGSEVTVDGEVLTIVNEDDVLAVSRA